MDLRKVIHLGLYLTILAFSCHASRSGEIAALEKELRSAQVKEKAAILNKLSRQYLDIDIERALKYGSEALAFAGKTDAREQQVVALANIAFGKAILHKWDEAKEYVGKSIQLAESADDTHGLIYALAIKGEIHDRLTEYRQALKTYTRRLALLQKTGGKNEIAKALFFVGSCKLMLGKYQEACDSYKRSLSLYEELGDQRGIANTLRYISSTYVARGDFGTASQYSFNSLKIFETLKDTLAIAKSYKHIGELYFDWNNKEESLTYLLKSLQLYEKTQDKGKIITLNQTIGVVYTGLKNFDLAEKHFFKALDLTKGQKRVSKTRFASIYQNLGSLYKEKNMFDVALDYYNKALGINRTLEDKTFLSITYREMAKIYEKMGSGLIALDYYKKSLVYFRNQDNVNMLVKLYREISGLYYKLKDYKHAYEYLNRFISIKDKIFTDDSAKKIAEMQAKYEAEKKEQQIEMLKKNNQIQQLTLEQEKITRYIFILSFLAIAVPAAFFIKKYRYLLTFWKRKNHIGHYRLMDKIASGGSGIVYRAHDILDKSREIAIKVLREEHSGYEDHKKRFKNEANIIDRFDHPNIVKVIERGESHGSLYIAMELLEGQTLAKIIGDGGCLNIPVVLEIMTQLAGAVAKIHQKNVIHRDLKPENIMIVEEQGRPPLVKLLDFGLSKSQSVTRLTKTGMILGTLFYMAPEQIMGSELTAAVDIYSLGVIYYEMISGQKPFTAENEENVIQLVLDHRPTKLSQLCPDVPAVLSNLIMRMIAKEPSARPPMEVIVQTLEEVEEESAHLYRSHPCEPT